MNTSFILLVILFSRHILSLTAFSLLQKRKKKKKKKREDRKEKKKRDGLSKKVKRYGRKKCHWLEEILVPALSGAQPVMPNQGRASTNGAVRRQFTTRLFQF